MRIGFSKSLGNSGVRLGFSKKLGIGTAILTLILLPFLAAYACLKIALLPFTLLFSLFGKNTPPNE